MVEISDAQERAPRTRVPAGGGSPSPGLVRTQACHLAQEVSMERRFALPVIAAVGLAALISSRCGMAAEQPPPGTIATVAGNGQLGFSGDGGPATQARLHTPFNLAVDATGNL